MYYIICIQICCLHNKLSNFALCFTPDVLAPDSPEKNHNKSLS